MRWTEPTTAAAPVAVAMPAEAPWPVVLVFGLCGLLVYCWRVYLVHQERMRAIERTPDHQMPELMRSIQRGQRRMSERGSG